MTEHNDAPRGGDEPADNYNDTVQAPEPGRKQQRNTAQTNAGNDVPEHAKLTEEEQLERTDSALADAEDFFVSRDESGDVRPVRTQAGGFGEILIRPLTYGQAETYFGDEGNVAEAEPDTVARIMREHVEEPDFEALCKEKFGKVTHGQTHYMNGEVLKNEMKSFAPQAVLNALIRESGMGGASVSVDGDGSAEIDFGDSGNQ